jgi:hypothetical protein
MNSMETFNPDAECLVHDQLNNELIAWKPEWAAHYREFAQPCDAPGLITWGMAYCLMGGASSAMSGKMPNAASEGAFSDRGARAGTCTRRNVTGPRCRYMCGLFAGNDLSNL